MFDPPTGKTGNPANTEWTKESWKASIVDYNKVLALAPSSCGVALAKAYPADRNRQTVCDVIPKADASYQWADDACKYCLYRPQKQSNSDPKIPDWWYGTGNGKHNPKRCGGPKMWFCHGGVAYQGGPDESNGFHQFIQSCVVCHMQ